ncbi:MAG TPA: type II secretion system protein [Epsilonproteobacteria bacterium]|nr:type II secretion system protein [Campylobacterota bacterium]
MQTTYRTAFTMLELTFVVVIIGILSAIAVPKFAATRDDATIAKAKTTIASVRNAVAAERQKRILRGSFTSISNLSSSSGLDKPIFDGFDGNISNSVLEYPLQSCKTASSEGCWRQNATGTEYTYNMPVSGSVVFELKNNRFDCKVRTATNCIRLTR